MAINNIEIEEFRGFSKRLATLAREYDLGKPEDLANALYENKECRELVKPRERKNKDGKIIKSSIKEKEAIKRAIQYHYGKEDAYKIQSTYMYAYSIIFNCSLDYLYGKTEVMSSNLEVVDICKKTGLSEDSVKALMETTEANIGNESGFSLPAWWSELMSGDSFYMLPMAWHSYADRIVQLNDIDKKAEALKKTFEKESIDSFHMNMQDMKADTLFKIRYEKEDSRMGAYHKMMSYVERFLNQYAEKWAEKQHSEYDEMYYRNEMNKIKIIESALKE